MDECENRGAVVDGKKCYCTPWERWTNCLEVGHCVRQSNLAESEEEQCKEEN